MNALRENKQAKEVNWKHFEKALKEVLPSLEGEEGRKYDAFKGAYKGTEYR